MSRDFFRPAQDVVDSMCNAYLDGRLDPAQQNGFEHLRVLDPRLESAMELQQDVEASLQRTMDAPDLSRLCSNVEALAAAATAANREENESGRAMSWVLAAAALLLMCLSVFFSSGSEQSASSTDIQIAQVLPTSLSEVAVMGAVGATAFLVKSLRARRERKRMRLGRATTATVLRGPLSLQFAGTLPR